MDFQRIMKAGGVDVVAKAAGVQPLTVTRFIRGESTTEAQRAAIESALGYIENPQPKAGNPTPLPLPPWRSAPYSRST